MGDPSMTRLNHRDAAWLAETFRRNRERFAGWHMEADPGTPPADPPSNPPADPPTDPPTDSPAGDGKGGKDAILADLAKERDRRQELEGKLTEFQTQQQAQMDAIAKALGLKSDDTPPDPEALTAQVQAEQAKARDAALQLAVFKSAAQHEANATRLLDSASFLASLKDVDPADADAVGGAIKAAIEADEMFKASPTPTTPPFPGGPRRPAGQPEPGPGLDRMRAAYENSATK